MNHKFMVAESPYLFQCKCGTMRPMSHPFKISLSRLQKEGKIALSEHVEEDFLEVHERDLDYTDPIDLKGSIELAGSAVLIKFSLCTTAKSPCIICGKPVKIEVNLSDVCHAEPLENIRGEIFDFSAIIRDLILTETEPYAECLGGCPERESLGQYLKNDAGTQCPFKDIDATLGEN